MIKMIMHCHDHFVDLDPAYVRSSALDFDMPDDMLLI